jgi:hypothetical protein
MLCRSCLLLQLCAFHRSWGRAAALAALAVVVVLTCVAPALLLVWQQGQQQQQQPMAAFLGYNTSSSSSTGWEVRQVSSAPDAEGTVTGPSLGIFPRGCKWRDVVQRNTSHVTYQYWDAASGQWSGAQPQACRLQGYGPPGEQSGGAKGGGHVDGEEEAGGVCLTQIDSTVCLLC